MTVSERVLVFMVEYLQNQINDPFPGDTIKMMLEEAENQFPGIESRELEKVLRMFDEPS